MCAYHEYYQNGHLKRVHYNGHRLTEKPEISGPPPIQFHNDQVYEQAARRLMAQLENQIGKLQFDAWMLRTFKPNATWREVLISAEMNLKHPEMLDCNCNLPEEHCAICDSIAHALSVNDKEAEFNFGT